MFSPYLENMFARSAKIREQKFVLRPASSLGLEVMHFFQTFTRTDMLVCFNLAVALMCSGELTRKFCSANSVNAAHGRPKSALALLFGKFCVHEFDFVFKVILQSIYTSTLRLKRSNVCQVLLTAELLQIKEVYALHTCVCHLSLAQVSTRNRKDSIWQLRKQNIAAILLHSHFFFRFKSDVKNLWKVKST